MKKLVFSLLGLGVVACQPQNATQNAGSERAVRKGNLPVVVAAPTATPRPDSIAPAEDELPAASPLVSSALSPAAQARFLQHHELGVFWRGSWADGQPLALDGFFGPEFRRISFFFQAARRDSLQPAVYHVSGKNRFRKTITSFEGDLTILSVRRVADELVGKLDLLDVVDNTSQVYLIKAAYHFREDPAAPGAGEFNGICYLDLTEAPTGELDIATSMNVATSTPSLGTGLWYKGNWKSYRGNLQQALSLSRNEFLTAPDALPTFGVGEREPTFNPKYAKLGWNTYWANDEWWTDSLKKPQVNL